MRPFDILVAGEINPDLILSGEVEPAFGQVEKLVDSAALVIGSSSAIFACGAARLGLKVAFIGVCGDDVWGRFMLAELAKRQVDISNVLMVPGLATGLSVILARRADRAILTFAGATAALRAEQVIRRSSPESLPSSRRFLFPSNRPPAGAAGSLPPGPWPWSDHFPRHELGPRRVVAGVGRSVAGDGCVFAQ